MKVQSRQKSIFKQSLYHISIASFIVMVIWVAYAIYFSYGKGSEEIVESNIRKNVEPFSANLHLDVAQSLSGRTTLDLTASTPPTPPPPSPTPTILPAQPSSPSATAPL